METIIDDENHQGVKRIYGVPTPYIWHEAANKQYVDDQITIVSGSSGTGTGGGGYAPALMLMGG